MLLRETNTTIGPTCEELLQSFLEIKFREIDTKLTIHVQCEGKY